MKIRITVGSEVAEGTLDDTPVAKDFASLLPLSMTLSDYASTEKVCDLPRKLSTEGAPAGYQAFSGDITYYAPWGNLAIFHRNFSYASGLIRLGEVISGMEILRRKGSFKAKIEAL